MKTMPRAALIFLFVSAAAVFGQSAGQTYGHAPDRTHGRAERALRALREGFPDRVGEIAFIDGDWTVRVAGELFFWANGRLLPEAYRHRLDYYGPHSFYAIAESPIPPSYLSPERIEHLRERGSSAARIERRDVHRAFQAALYGGGTRREIEALQRRVEFLGFRISVHRDIVDAVARVEAEIMEWEGAEAFIATLGSAYGFNWRQIAGTQRMSYHSWGLAIDILPRNMRGQAIFWQWERNLNPDWMLLPLERRWNPPAQVIEAFRRQGFIWGGNWAFFDNMHFEFRPELLAYTRLLAEDSQPAAAGVSLHHVYPDGFR